MRRCSQVKATAKSVEYIASAAIYVVPERRELGYDETPRNRGSKSKLTELLTYAQRRAKAIWPLFFRFELSIANHYQVDCPR